MALPPPSTTPPPVTGEQFIADRQGVWGAFTNATTGAIVVLVVLLACMAIFLV